MKKSDLRKNHEAFDEAIGRYRQFIDKIINAERVVSTADEKRDLAESTLLRLCANWERFLDEHLVDCVNCAHTKLSKYFAVSIPNNPSRDLCHALIIGAAYKDFRSFGELKTYSKKILHEDSNPFLSIRKVHCDKIDEVYKIRNYLSHYSQASKRSLREVYRSKYNMQHFLEPGQFLLAYKARRLWAYFGAFEGASDDMKASY